MFRVQPSCSVLFLAGGRSLRMGRPKAWLEFGGRPLLAHLVERMAAVFPEVIVVCAPGQELPDLDVRIVHDEDPGQGPVAGLVVGLRETTQPRAFVASCDAPFVDPRFACALLDRSDGYDVTVPEWEGRLHPLQAVYRASVQPLLARQLAEGRRRLLDLLPQVRTRIVSEDEIRGIDPEGRSLLNMNTPEEYQRALELWTR
jgi:molybdopterin-guanine dinucleotide biosynthesis protein A